MPEHLQRVLLITLVILIGTAAHAADDERWYRVELLVIGQGDEPQGELFDPMPSLTYPDAMRFLLDPELLKELQSQQRQLANKHPVELDEFGRILITRSGENATEAVPAQAPDIYAPLQPKYEQQNDATVAAAEVPDEDQPAPRPTPFIALPDDVRELNTAARSLARGGRHNVLFHQSWNQPVNNKSQALPIVLDNSGNSAQWSELQGSILLYRSRYLHIETNLWRNTDGRYLHRQWRMPPAPLGPPSIITENPFIEKPLPLERPLLSEFAAVEEPAPITPENPAGGISEQTLDTALSLEPVYPYRHAVLMQQKRRMRSNEVHYIDHPMLGLVIKITPLTEEDLSIQAELEQQLWPHVKDTLEKTRAQSLQ